MGVTEGRSATDEAPLLVAVASGDPEAARDLVDRYSGLIWSIVRRRSLEGDDAEDAVQEIFIDLWRNADRFDPSKASEKTFVTMVARRRLIDRWRRTQRRPIGSSDELDADRMVDVANPDLEQRAEAVITARVLNELPEDRRRLLKLSIFYGMSHQEIADETRLALGTVKSHLRRSLITVRQRLLETAPSPGPSTERSATP